MVFACEGRLRLLLFPACGVPQLFGTVFLLLFERIGISSMLSVDSLSQLVPGLKDWADENPYLIAAWEALSGSRKTFFINL